MPTTRDYRVRFAKADSYEMAGQQYWQIAISDWMRDAGTVVSAASFLDLEKEVRSLAKAQRRSVSPSIQLNDRKARKPAGFDAFCKSLHVIEYVPEGWAQIEAGTEVEP